MAVECGFTSYPTYIRTYRNELADWVSKPDLDEVRSKLARQGGLKLPLMAIGGKLLRTLVVGLWFCPQVVMSWSVPLGKLLVARSAPSPVPSRVWLHTSWEVVCQGPVIFSSAALALAKHGLEPAVRRDRVWASLSQDPHGTEWQRVVDRLTSGPCKIVAVDIVLDRLRPDLVPFFPCALVTWVVSPLGEGTRSLAFKVFFCLKFRAWDKNVASPLPR